MKSTKNPKKIILVILLLSIFINLFFFTATGYYVIKKGGINYIARKFKRVENSQTLSNFEKPYYLHKTSQFNILPNTEDEIIFLGDSITDGCEWSELFQNNKIKNRGIGSDTTIGVLKRLQEVYTSKPEKIFIMIGIYDLGLGRDIDDILNNYNEIIKRISEKSPNTELIIQSILPINKEIYGNGIKNKTVIDLNTELEKLASQQNLTFVNLFNIFDDGNENLSNKYTVDGIHLNGDGYVLWKNSISDLVFGVK